MLILLEIQVSTGFELNHLPCGDSDFLLGGGVNALTCILLDYHEGTKADKSNLIILLLQSACD